MPSKILTRCLAALLVATSVASVRADETPFDARLQQLVARLQTELDGAHVAGMALAVVRHDEVVLTHGFGMADIDGELPVTPETIFAVGSTTKAFTSAVIASLVAEGKLHWDDPVGDVLPTFELRVRSKEPGARATLRDLLSHRSGFTRMSVLWAGAGQDVTRDDILRTAAKARPWDDLRENFHYCNVTYLAAGVAAGAAAGSSWETLVGERILTPLGMTSSTLSVHAARQDPRLAQGYKWNPHHERFDPTEMLELETIGPAGSINSNVLDMAQWVRLQLGRGVWQGQQLIGAEQLAETWSPQIAMGRGAHYGMGWMLHERDGHAIVEHGGNIIGFSAQVGLFPDDDLGYVLLANVSSTPLQQGSLAIVHEILLADAADEDGGADSEDGADAGAPSSDVDATGEDFSPYLGRFIADFGPFDDARFEVLVQNERLAVDVPGQTVYELLPPDATGRRFFALTDAISVHFSRSSDGEVVELHMEQAGMTFDCPREGVELQPEIPLADLEPYLGSFRDAESDDVVSVVLSNNRLAVDVPGQTTYELHRPDDNGRRVLRLRDSMSVSFDEETRDSFVLDRDEGRQVFERVDDADAPKLPSVDELLALRRTDQRVAAAAAAGGRRVSYSLHMLHAGLSGTASLAVRGDHVARRLDFGKFGGLSVVLRGGEAQSYHAAPGLEQLEGDDLQRALLTHPDAVDGDWRQFYDHIEVVGADLWEEIPVWELRLTRGQLAPVTYLVDQLTGDVVEQRSLTGRQPMLVPETIGYKDYRDVAGGLRTAFYVESRNRNNGKTVLEVQRVETGVSFDDADFTLESPER